MYTSAGLGTAFPNSKEGLIRAVVEYVLPSYPYDEPYGKASVEEEVSPEDGPAPGDGAAHDVDAVPA